MPKAKRHANSLILIAENRKKDLADFSARSFLFYTARPPKQAYACAFLALMAACAAARRAIGTRNGEQDT